MTHHLSFLLIFIEQIKTILTLHILLVTRSNDQYKTLFLSFSSKKWFHLKFDHWFVDFLHRIQFFYQLNKIFLFFLLSLRLFKKKKKKIFSKLVLAVLLIIFALWVILLRINCWPSRPINRETVEVPIAAVKLRDVTWSHGISSVSAFIFHATYLQAYVRFARH